MPRHVFNLADAELKIGNMVEFFDHVLYGSILNDEAKMKDLSVSDDMVE